MTAIAGFPGIGVPGDPKLPYVILGADSEETGEGFSASVRKIEVIEGDGFKCALAGSGNGDFIDLAIQQVRSNIQPPFTLESVREQIEEIVTTIYNERIDRYPGHQHDDLEFSLLGAVWVAGVRDVHLIRIRRALSLVQTKPTSLGLGRDLAYFVLETLYLPGINAYSGTRLMVYLLAQLKKHVPDVGGKTQVVVLDGDGKLSELWESTITQHELSTSTVMDGAKWLFHLADPMGAGYDMVKVDQAVDLVSGQLKTELRKAVGGIVAAQVSAASNLSAVVHSSTSVSAALSASPLGTPTVLLASPSPGDQAGEEPSPED
jgi:20S proteasome alpha/beta subunit